MVYHLKIVVLFRHSTWPPKYIGGLSRISFNVEFGFDPIPNYYIRRWRYLVTWTNSIFSSIYHLNCFSNKLNFYYEGLFNRSPWKTSLWLIWIFWIIYNDGLCYQINLWLNSSLNIRLKKITTGIWCFDFMLRAACLFHFNTIQLALL